MKKEKNNSDTLETKNKSTEKAPVSELKKVDKSVNKVGKLLKEMRLQKELSISDVSKKLCIRKIYLEAIEDSNYKELPPLPYGIGFIRSYAEYLGLNSGNIVELYKEETNTKPDKDIFVLEPQNEASVPNRKYLLISLLAIIFIYFLWYLYNNKISDIEEPESEALVEEKISEDQNELPLVVEDYSVAAESADNSSAQSQAENGAKVITDQVTVTDASFPLAEEKNNEEKPIADEPKKEENIAPAKTVEQPQEKVAEAKPVEGVVINIKKETWIEVKDDKKLYISKVLQAGDSYKVPEGKGMILSVGRVEAVDVLINGKVTQIFKPEKKTNIALDPFLNADNH